MATPHPHLRDWWAGYRFAPRRVATVHNGAWIVDASLPVYIHVDLETETVSGPWSAQADLGQIFVSSDVAADGDRLYVVGERGLHAVDPEAGTCAWRLPNARSEVRVAGGRIWSHLGPDSVEIDRGGRVMRRLGLPGGVCRACVPADGWQAVLTTPERAIDPLTVARFEDGAVRPTWRRTLDGTPNDGGHSIAVSAGIVWVAWDTTTWRAGCIRHFLSGLDAETGETVSEVEIERDVGDRMIIHHGVAWRWVHVPDEDGRPVARELTAIDATTGAMAARHQLGVGALPFPEAGPAGVWCALWRDGPFLQGLTAPGEPLRTISLACVDASRFRPPPPPSITVEATEGEALSTIRTALFGDRTPLTPRVTVEAVVLEGAFPRTELVVYFRSEDRPGYVFGRSVRLWEDDGACVVDYDLAVTCNLEEDLVACRHGLPGVPEPDDTGVVWF